MAAQPKVAVDNTAEDAPKRKRAPFTRKAPEVVVELGFRAADGTEFSLGDGETVFVKNVHKDINGFYAQVAKAVLSGNANARPSATVSVTIPQASKAE